MNATVMIIMNASVVHNCNFNWHSGLETLFVTVLYNKKAQHCHCEVMSLILVKMSWKCTIEALKVFLCLIKVLWNVNILWLGEADEVVNVKNDNKQFLWL